MQGNSANPPFYSAALIYQDMNANWQFVFEGEAVGW